MLRKHLFSWPVLAWIFLCLFGTSHASALAEDSAQSNQQINTIYQPITKSLTSELLGQSSTDALRLPPQRGRDGRIRPPRDRDHINPRPRPTPRDDSWARPTPPRRPPPRRNPPRRWDDDDDHWHRPPHRWDDDDHWSRPVPVPNPPPSRPVPPPSRPDTGRVTSCDFSNSADICRMIRFRYERPHNLFNLKWNSGLSTKKVKNLTIKSIHNGHSSKRSVAGIRKLIVTYKNGQTQDIVYEAKGLFPGNVSNKGVLFLTKRGQMTIPLWKNRRIKNISIQADSWIGSRIDAYVSILLD